MICLFSLRILPIILLVKGAWYVALASPFRFLSRPCRPRVRERCACPLACVRIGQPIAALPSSICDNHSGRGTQGFTVHGVFASTLDHGSGSRAGLTAAWTPQPDSKTTPQGLSLFSLSLCEASPTSSPSQGPGCALPQSLTLFVAATAGLCPSFHSLLLSFVPLSSATRLEINISFRILTLRNATQDQTEAIVCPSSLHLSSKSQKLIPPTASV